MPLPLPVLRRRPRRNPPQHQGREHERHHAARVATAAVATVATIALPAAADAATPGGRDGSVTTAAAATSCYGGAITTDLHSPDLLGPYVTSGRCHDINIRIVSGDYSTFNVCVIFVKHTNRCNHNTAIHSSWVTIATDVKDGTTFTVAGGVDEEGGMVKVQLAY